MDEPSNWAFGSGEGWLWEEGVEARYPNGRYKGRPKLRLNCFRLLFPIVDGESAKLKRLS
jgi:hypothetical protein